MFIVETKSVEDFTKAALLARHYKVNAHIVPKDISGNDTNMLIVTSLPEMGAVLYGITTEEAQHEYVMCEMAFQGAFLQKGQLKCAMCARLNVSTCGHLTFTEFKEV